MFPTILIVDDEPAILKSLGGLLTDEGFQVSTALNGYEALKAIESDIPDLVLLDIWMPGIDGIETLKEIKKQNRLIQVIMITGHGTIDTAVEAIKLGAFGFIEKPLSFDKIVLSINNALNFRKLEEENIYLRKKVIEKYAVDGNSAQVKALRKQVIAVAPTDAWIFICGENGTGKELTARTIHQLSPRSENPFIDVNCAAIPEKFIESELFGHEKGTFPEAAAKKIGKFELAAGGTLFFDEIGDMSLKIQAKILRVLQEQEFQRTGGDRVIKFDARVIAASNMDIQKRIKQGLFREDLFYRLNVVPVNLAPLRERKEDIPILVSVFLEKLASDTNSEPKKITQNALDVLGKHEWRGNVRELKNFIHRLSIMVQDDTIHAHDISKLREQETFKEEAASIPEIMNIQKLKEAKKIFELEFIKNKLSQNNNDLSETAKAIGVHKSYVYKKLKEAV